MTLPFLRSLEKNEKTHSQEYSFVAFQQFCSVFSLKLLSTGFLLFLRPLLKLCNIVINGPPIAHLKNTD